MIDTAIDTALLRRLAKAATPGPWVHLFGDRFVYTKLEDGGRGNHIVGVGYPAFPDESANMSFIAACNPAAIIALLDRMDKADQFINAMRHVEEYLMSVAEPDSLALDVSYALAEYDKRTNKEWRKAKEA